MLFSNNGDKKFNVTAIEAGFTYPQDLSYYIQNVRKKKSSIVPPFKMLMYSFIFGWAEIFFF